MGRLRPLGRQRGPAVIVSSDSANRFLNRVQVVPLSSNTTKLYPSEARVRIKIATAASATSAPSRVIPVPTARSSLLK